MPALLFRARCRASGPAWLPSRGLSKPVFCLIVLSIHLPFDLHIVIMGARTRELNVQSSICFDRFSKFTLFPVKGMQEMVILFTEISLLPR